jgi:hypothetical protein
VSFGAQRVPIKVSGGILPWWDPPSPAQLLESFLGIVDYTDIDCLNVVRTMGKSFLCDSDELIGMVRGLGRIGRLLIQPVGTDNPNLTHLIVVAAAFDCKCCLKTTESREMKESS